MLWLISYKLTIINQSIETVIVANYLICIKDKHYFYS